MKQTLLILVFSSLLYWSGCRPVTRDYSTTDGYTLTNKKAVSPYSGLSINIPVGWREIDSEEFDIWLVDDDYSASIIFTPINIGDSLTETSTSPSNKISELLTYSKAMEKAKHQNSFNQISEDDFYALGELKAGSYKYKIGNGLERRAVVFPFKEGFYECKAVITNEESNDNTQLLFKVQDSILNSI